jgi:hypothetical protein
VLQVTGTAAFLCGFSGEVEMATGVPAPPVHQHSPGKAHISVIKWYGVEAKCLAIWLYQQHAGLTLERKAVLAEEFVRWEPKVFRQGRVTARMWELFGGYLP